MAEHVLGGNPVCKYDGELDSSCLRGRSSSSLSVQICYSLSATGALRSTRPITASFGHQFTSRTAALEGSSIHRWRRPQAYSPSAASTFSAISLLPRVSLSSIVGQVSILLRLVDSALRLARDLPQHCARVFEQESSGSSFCDSLRGFSCQA